MKSHYIQINLKNYIIFWRNQSWKLCIFQAGKFLGNKKTLNIVFIFSCINTDNLASVLDKNWRIEKRIFMNMWNFNPLDGCIISKQKKEKTYLKYFKIQSYLVNKSTCPCKFRISAWIMIFDTECKVWNFAVFHSFTFVTLNKLNSLDCVH